MRKTVLSCLSALSASCLLAACVPGLSDDGWTVFWAR